MIGIEAHTLRYYERLGLVQPERSGGNIRLYSEEDVDRLRYIKALMSDCGVNLAGVEVVLKLMQRMKDMQRQLEEMEKKVKMIGETEIEDMIEDIIEDVEWKEV
jgi:MerR family transcriptional regulator/heat shock protein HspR